MSDVPTVSSSDDEEESTAETVSEYFETEYDIDAAAAGEFLIALGETLQDDDAVTISGDDWDISFAFEEPVELEDGDELEIELELDGHVAGDDADTSGNAADDGEGDEDADDDLEVILLDKTMHTPIALETRSGGS